MTMEAEAAGPADTYACGRSAGREQEMGHVMAAEVHASDTT